MSTAAPQREAAAAAGPSAFQRRRRRRFAAAAGVAVLAAAAVVVVLVTRGPGALPKFTVAYGQGNVAQPDGIVASQPDLAKTVPARLKFVPFDAGVTAIAELRSGALQAISGVGNPPVVGALGNGTGVTVVIAQSFDADALIVPPAVKSAQDLVGKSVGVLTGSSEDFELRGWLDHEGLTGKVKVVGLESEQAVAAGYLSGALQAGYVQAGPEAQLVAKGGHALTDAQKIAELGIPGINVVAVADSAIKSHPDLVQKYVCAEVAATRDLTGPQADKYLTQAAGVQGVPANLIVQATHKFPFIPLDQQLRWLGATPHDPGSPLVDAYAQTAKFLVGQGRIESVPPRSLLAQHVDSSFVKKALSGGCDG
jgi:NitT/TauT family transport system substrate-binding protein